MVLIHGLVRAGAYHPCFQAECAQLAAAFDRQSQGIYAVIVLTAWGIIANPGGGTVFVLEGLKLMAQPTGGK